MKTEYTDAFSMQACPLIPAVYAFDAAIYAWLFTATVNVWGRAVGRTCPDMPTRTKMKKMTSYKQSVAIEYGSKIWAEVNI